MKGHVKDVILHRFNMPKKMLLRHLHPLVISFKLGISFSATKTANDSQSKTSKNGRT
ncbi:uncharacterized protein LOC113323739 [Papaver somniferum]|uniref:uncharacterized protein LOC113323739 n=1 Tax=Papaver somniferum TaxID=3469 RepID=UPI000E6FE53A|nr:uncharacterized protein LOC113323739 [Papaver somniferum]